MICYLEEKKVKPNVPIQAHYPKLFDGINILEDYT